MHSKLESHEDSNLPRAGLYLDSFRQLGEDQRFFLSLLFIKNNQLKIINILKKAYSEMGNSAPSHIQWNVIQSSKGNSDTHYNRDEPGRHDTKCHKRTNTV